MTISTEKLNMILARKCVSISSLQSSISSHTIQKIQSGGDVGPKTVGKVATQLGVDVEDLLA